MLDLETDYLELKQQILACIGVKRLDPNVLVYQLNEIGLVWREVYHECGSMNTTYTLEADADIKDGQQVDSILRAIERVCRQVGFAPFSNWCLVAPDGRVRFTVDVIAYERRAATG